MMQSTEALILNVDDNEASRYVRRRILEQAGFQTHEAASGEDALRLAGELHPSVMLLDVHLPDISGLEVVRRIKADPKTLSTLILQISATFTHSRDSVRALDGGADAYLIEPIDPEVLVANVKALMRISQAGRLARQLKFTSENASEAHYLLDREGQIYYANRTACEQLGYGENELLMLNEADIQPDFDRPAFEQLFDAAQDERVPLQRWMRRRRDGAPWPVEVSVTGVCFDGRPYLFVSGRDISERLRDEAALQFMVQVGAKLAQSIDYTSTLKQATGLLVPALADFCVIEMAGPDGKLEVVAVEHVDPAKEKLIRAVVDRFPPEERARNGSPVVWRSGQSRLVPEIPQDWLAPKGDAEVVHALRTLNPRSAMVVPLVARGRTIGTISLLTSAARSSFGQAELRLVELVAPRIALAIENARLFQSSQELGEQLEQRVVQRTDELRRANTKLSRLAEHLQSVREAERRDLSRELHDGMGQMLTAIRMDLKMLEQKLAVQRSAEPWALQEVGNTINLVDETIESMRVLVKRLRPDVLDDLGLVAALEWLVSEFRTRSDMTCTFQSNVEWLPVEGERALALFRIVQEALTNVARHAEASAVQVIVEQQAATVAIEVRDDGQGASPEALARADAFGVMSMHERAQLLEARLEIRGVPGQGTTVRVEVQA